MNVHSILLLFALAGFAAHSGAVHASRNAADDLIPYESIPKPRARAAVDWKQPPLGCVEEMIPHPEARACLDLSSVAQPLKDWPSSISQEEHDFWYAHRRGLTNCRAEEVLRREAAAPGSQSAGALETAWMISDSNAHYAQKVDAIYEASNRYGVPAHVLTGAVYQESLFSELGIADDGGNYSCGMEQINLQGWCVWANQQSAAEKAAMNWPRASVNCSDMNLVSLGLITPLYRIAKSNLNGLPEYRLNKTHFQGIALSDVVGEWPAADARTNDLRFQLITSFINNCADPRLGILAKANELRAIFNRYLSPALQAKDRYAPGERFQRRCKEAQSTSDYPLHTGWLMAVASYNAGPRAVDAVTYYNQWNRTTVNDPQTVKLLDPANLVEALYWAGKYNPLKDKIEFSSVTGAARNWIWFKGCVVQRHIARVQQHVTLLPEFFVDGLEGAYPCAPSRRDENGNPITSVPPARQTSSGVRGP